MIDGEPMASEVSVLQGIQAELRDEYLASHTYPWIVGYSGGKDSTLLAQLVFELLMSLAPGDRKRPVHILCNDTLVESPILMAYIDRQLSRLSEAAENLHLPITVVKTSPAPDQTFWVNLIGRGYPAPTRSFRWCTDRMKIQPTSNHILKEVSSNGEVILLLGVRRAESAARAITANRHANAPGTRLNPHDDLKGCKVFRPLLELSNEGVWQLLLQRRPPWGGSHRGLRHLVQKRPRRRVPYGYRQKPGPFLRHVLLPVRMLDVYRSREGPQHGGIHRGGLRAPRTPP